MIEGRRPVVLIVDDEPRILSALVRALRREGYELLTADRPEDALRLVEERQVDCIVSDYKMPAMTGLELLERLARRRPGAPCLLLTGWPNEIDAAARARVGVHTVLQKPWDDVELKLALRKAMGLEESELG